MPLYKSDHVEYTIESGHIRIVMDNGGTLPAYWAHPARGNRFPGVALIHNWWGITDVVRRMAHLFAQTGYYVVVPDLFNGALPRNHNEAAEHVKQLGEGGFIRIDAALSVLETHHRCNRKVAAVGIGMGGSLAFEAAIKRDDLEVAVSFYGFPQKYLGQFAQANTPILAIYGTKDTIIKPAVVKRLRDELVATPLKDDHQVALIEGAPHDFITDHPQPETRRMVSEAWQTSIAFIDKHIQPPPKESKKVI